MSRRHTPAAVLILALLVPAAGMSQLPATFTEELQKRLQVRHDAGAVAAGRQAIAEARRAGDGAALRDALILVAAAAMRVESFEAGMRVLREEQWPSGPAEATTLHLIAAIALLEQPRRPDGAQGTFSIPNLRLVANELDRNALHLARVAEAERHLEAAWQARTALPARPEDAFGGIAYQNWSPAPHLGETARETLSMTVARALARREAWRGIAVATRLDNAALLAPPPVSPGDAATHPAVRAAAVLADLEAWHLARGDRGAALRALRTAMTALSQVAYYPDRRSLLDAYERRLEAYRDLPGYSGALAELAGAVWNVGYSQPEGRTRSRELAAKGRDAHPGTPGARECASILAGSGPALELAAMRSDGPGHPSLQVRTRGLTEVFLRAYRVDAASTLELFADAASQRNEVLGRITREGQPVATWSVRPQVPDDGDLHATWVTPPLAVKGGYVITAASGPNLAENTMWSAVPFLLTSIVVVARADDERGTEVTVVSGDTGKPQRGVTVERVSLSGPESGKATASVVTDHDGRAVVPAAPPGSQTTIVARRGDELAVMERTWGEEARSETPLTMIVTDRHRYRAGDKVRFLLLTAHQETNGVTPRTGETLAVTLSDGTGKALRRLRPTTDAFGMAHGALTVPPGRPPGEWELALEGEQSAGASVEVVEDAGMRVDLDVPTQPVEAGASFAVRGRLSGPDPATVSAATIRWSLRALGGIVDMGETGVDAAGGFAFATRAPAMLPEHSLTVDALASSAGSRTFRSAEVPFVQPIRLYVDWGTSWVREGAAVPLTVNRTRGSTPAPGQSHYRVFRLGPPSERPASLPGLTAADLLPARWERNEISPAWRDEGASAVEVAQGVMVHGDDGRATVEISGLPPGRHRIEITTDDGAGGTLKATDSVIVLTRDGHAPPGIPWILASASASLEAGQPWQILVHCADRRQRYALEHFVNGEIVARSARRGSSIESFPETTCRTARHELRMWFVRDYLLTAADSPWVVNCREALDVRVEDGRTDGLLIKVVGRGGRVLGEGEVQAFAVFAPPEDEVGPERREPPEPWLLVPGARPLGKLASSLGEAKGAWFGGLGRSSPSPEREPQPGALFRLIGTGVADPEAAAIPRDGAEATVGAAPAEAPALPEPDPLTFQPVLTPGPDGVIRVSLPGTRPSRTLWVVALARDLTYGFTELTLTDAPAK